MSPGHQKIPSAQPPHQTDNRQNPTSHRPAEDPHLRGPRLTLRYWGLGRAYSESRRNSGLRSWGSEASPLDVTINLRSDSFILECDAQLGDPRTVRPRTRRCQGGVLLSFFTPPIHPFRVCGGWPTFRRRTAGWPLRSSLPHTDRNINHGSPGRARETMITCRPHNGPGIDGGPGQNPAEMVNVAPDADRRQSPRTGS